MAYYVYVLTDSTGHRSKVGFSENPPNRQKVGQTWGMKELAWGIEFGSRRVAYMVEQRSHEGLEAAGFARLSKEVFECTPEQAKRVILREIKMAWQYWDDRGELLEIVSATPLDAIFI